MATQKGRKPASSRKSGGGRKTNNKNQQSFSSEVKDEVILLIAIAVTILLFLCNFHLIGKVGDALSNVMFGLFGLLAYIAPPALFFALLFGTVNLGNRTAIIKLASAIVLFIDMEVILALMTGIEKVGDSAGSYYAYATDHIFSGGVIGAAIAVSVTGLIGIVGTIAVVLIVMILCLVLLTEKSFVKGVANGSRKMYETARDDYDRRIVKNEELYKQRMEARSQRELQKEERKKKRMEQKVSGVSVDTAIPKQMDISEHIMPDVDDVREQELFTEADELDNITIKGIAPAEPQKEPTARVHKVKVLEKEEPLDMQKISSALEASADRFGQDAEVVAEQKAGTGVASDQIAINPAPVRKKPYKKPPISLLQKNSKSGGGNSEKQLKETAMQLKQTLKTFGVNVTITDISQGPAVTRYELQPEMGVKVSKIVNLTDDIKLNLAATDIRIEAPIPGKAAIGIEVPNKENSMVALRDLFETSTFKEFNSNIAFAVGKDIAGQTVVADIAKMPHVLIAGSTGSGKSVCINTLIMSILYKATPDEVKLIMVDPKVVELSVYNGIPHLMLPVVTDPKKAAAALHWGVQEMTERYKKFEDLHVRDLKGYNKKVEEMTENGGEELPQKLPQIVIIVDELADLMMVAPGEVEESICRLAQLARAAGIHLVIATQRPSVDVITGLIKANMPSRVAFAVSSGVDSRTILDMNGAEKLLGKGDMLFYPQGYPKPVRVQGAFVSDKEVADVVDFLKAQNTGDDADIHAMEAKIASMGIGSDSSGAKGSGGDEKDIYFADAGRFIIEKEKASIGMLQRVFKIGFNRAARIMDQLCDYGVVGEEEGTKPRKVLMTLEQFEQLLEEI
ncbi:MAG: DNA translocase FtsK [Lachnospiraceae bacterium]|nr:DNA translocase FtsK [Lachnospiraceae bacterium]